MAFTTRLIPALLLGAIVAGCGAAPRALDARAIGGDLAARATAPANRAEFLKELDRRHIHLSDSQLDTLARERSLTPSGEFASRPAADLTGPENLGVHFKKHGHQFKPPAASEEDYVARGIAAATGDHGKVRFYFDTTSFKKDYQSHVVRWVTSTREFTAFRANGDMTTFYLNDRLAGNRFIEVPLLD